MHWNPRGQKHREKGKHEEYVKIKARFLGDQHSPAAKGNVKNHKSGQEEEKKVTYLNSEAE